MQPILSADWGLDFSGAGFAGSAAASFACGEAMAGSEKSKAMATRILWCGKNTLFSSAGEFKQSLNPVLC